MVSSGNHGHACVCRAALPRRSDRRNHDLANIRRSRHTGLTLLRGAHTVSAVPRSTATQMPVHIKSQVTPLLVAYRDGFTDKNGQPVAWKMATPSTSVDFMISGAYSVAVVCMVNGAPLTWEAFHTVDDDTSDTVKEPTL